MPHARRAALAVLLALSALAAGSAGVSAHALLAASDPAANAVLATAPAAVTLTFTEQPDPKLSSVQVLDASGASRAAGPAVPGASGSNTLTVPLGPLPDGVYTVAWRTVSATDGHATAGSFAFSVGTGAPPPSATSAAPSGASTVSAASVAARALLYLGLIVLLGALFTGSRLVQGRARRVVRLRTLGWIIAVLGAIGVALAGAADAGVSVVDLVGTTLGVDALARLVPILLAGGLLLVASRRRATRGPLISLAAALAALALLADAAASHAASVLLPQVNVGLQWLHAVAISIWLGGLAGVVLELGDPDSGARAALTVRFSRWATAGILLVAVTGVARAAFELHNPGELLSTDYGHLIVAKTALFAVLAALGAVNHFRHVPGGELRISALRRVGSVELLVGATIVVLASVLVTTPPPADTGAAGTGGPRGSPGQGTLVVDGNDYGTTVRVRLTISPGTAGPNAFGATVADYDTGAAEAVTSMTLRFSLPSRPGVGGSSLPLQLAGDGSFTATGSNLSLAGTWTVTALVVEPATSVEVSLSVTVAAAPTKVDVNRVPGQPSIYTVHLDAGASAQLYLDSWAAGAADLHITYFDAGGKELPVTSIAATAAATGSAPAAVTMTPIEPGHAVGHVRTAAGVAIAFVVTGTAPDGHQISFSLTITPDR